MALRLLLKPREFSGWPSDFSVDLHSKIYLIKKKWWNFDFEIDFQCVKYKVRLKSDFYTKFWLHSPIQDLWGTNLNSYIVGPFNFRSLMTLMFGNAHADRKNNKLPSLNRSNIIWKSLTCRVLGRFKIQIIKFILPIIIFSIKWAGVCGFFSFIMLLKWKNPMNKKRTLARTEPL